MKTNIDMNVLCSAGLYLRGDALIPDRVSALLGRKPTKSWRQGDEHTTTLGNKIVRESGLWSLVETSHNLKINDLIKNIFDQLSSVNSLFDLIDGLEEAELAVFVAQDSAENVASTIEFTISPEILSSISRYGVCLSFEIGVVDK